MSISADETYAVYDERPSRARKEHVCSACKETIPRGQVYTRVRWVFDGSADGVKRCARCQALHEALRDICDSGEQEWPAEKLNCGHTFEEAHGRPPPAHLAALAFWLPGDPLPQMNDCAPYLGFHEHRAAYCRQPGGGYRSCRTNSTRVCSGDFWRSGATELCG